MAALPTCVHHFPKLPQIAFYSGHLVEAPSRLFRQFKLLAAQITRHPSDTTLYDLQARAYAMQGKALEQHQAQAYSYAWQGKLYAALEQLELAKQAGGSFYQLSTVESDLRELRGMLDARGKP